MQIIPGVIADHTALFFEKERILSFADLHLGYDAELHAKGVHIPTNEFAYQRNLITSLVAKYKPAIVILNGDIKHNFGGINDNEWRHALQLFDAITPHAELVIIKGNHDTIIAPIARKRNILIVDNYRAGDTLFLHGDVLPEATLFENITTVIIGHEHPAIGLTNGIRTEYYKCFLKLPWQKRTLLVQPSTFSLTTGVDVLSKTLHSPFLTDISRAEAFVIGETGDVLAFGKINNI